MSKPGAQRGFTLLELLVALAIFAFMAAVMYSGTQLVIEEREVVNERLTELQNMQRTVRLLQTDFTQLYPRAVRDELGRGAAPALATERQAEITVLLTRTGWRNPDNLNPRGNLQRVRYRYDPETATLYRDYWPVVDRVLASEPREEELLQGVTDFNVEFLDGSDNWQEGWPLPGATNNSVLPRAVRYRLELTTYGEITRLVEVAG